VDVGRAGSGVLERADADEGQPAARASVVRPECHAAVGAAQDDLALAGGGGGRQLHRVVGEDLDPVGLDHRIQRMRPAGLALAPGAVAGMHEERPVGQPVADAAAGAVAFHQVLPQGVHAHAGSIQTARKGAVPERIAWVMPGGL
jgi:hypothetical protein